MRNRLLDTPYGLVVNAEYGFIYNEYPNGHPYAASRNGKITKQGRSDRFDHPEGYYSTRISSKNNEGYVDGAQLKASAEKFNYLIEELVELKLLVLENGLEHKPESMLRIVQEGFLGRLVRVELNLDSLGDGLNSNLSLFSFHLQKGTVFNIKFNNDDYFKSLLESKFDISNFQSVVWREGFDLQEFLNCFKQMIKHFESYAGEDIIILKNYLALLLIQNSKQPSELVEIKPSSSYKGNTYVRMAGGINDWLPYLAAGIKPLYVARCFHRTNIAIDIEGNFESPANSVEELCEIGNLPFSWYKRLV